MICKHKRAAWAYLILRFAAVAFATVNPALPAASDISLSPANLTFKYQVGSALPASQNLQIKSTGAVLAFTLSVTGPLPYSAQWLTVSPDFGTTSKTIRVSVNPTGLPSGTYTATIVISSPSAATPTQNYPVRLDVGDAPATLSASSGALTFTYVTGGATPSTQALVLMTSGGALTASITVTGGTWLKVSPSASIALVGLPATLTVAVDTTGLNPGTYTGKITLASASAANKSVAVDVTLNVTAGVPAINSGGIWPPGALVNSAALTATVRGVNFFPTSVASIGVTTLTTAYLSPTTLLVTIPANLMTAAGNLSIVITTPTAASLSAAGTFVVYGPGPQVWAVANSASYTSSTISPGGIITIYGVNLGPSSLTVFPGTTPIPTTLPASGAATSILINGASAPLLYTSSTQVSCIVPYSLSSKIGNSVNLVLTYNSVASAAFPLSVVAADPGMFTVDASGTGQGAILNYNAVTGDYIVNGTANAAAKGSTVVLYITGFGLTSCADAPGSTCIPSATEADLIAGTVTPTGAVAVTIDGQTATVQAAVAPIGSVPGLLQINATVPTGAKTGTAVPVVVSVGSAHSQSRVTMAVK
jgi:uncharacterized protein (TIGR03437 family)